MVEPLFPEVEQYIRLQKLNEKWSLLPLNL
jgi:hypothetical protein